MKKKSCRNVMICFAAAMSLSLTACGSQTESGKGQPETETAAESVSQEPEKEMTEAAVSEEAAPETGEAQAEDTEPESESESKDGEMTALPNPIQEVDSSSDFETIGITLKLPENEEWYSGAAYAVIDGKVAQISFYDEIADSFALVRAGDEKAGDPSGIYYNFDDKKKESWSAVMEDGFKIHITIQVTEKNADVHGALASWSYEGTRYSLWEDDARDRTDAVAKMAIEIAKNCSNE